MNDRATSEPPWEIPRIPASAGAMVFDATDRILLLKPSYKAGWTIPGGMLEATGESPWECCQRETYEECGLRIESARLACIDFLRPRPDRPGGMRFLFDCGRLAQDQLRTIRLGGAEIVAHRFARLDEAGSLLSGPVKRRVLASAGRKRCVYLESGRRIDGVR